ncbi:hypothetical protein [Bifidobacterium criceti]|uniref:Phosphoesterase/phosphohydrolase n=1 Tax=Bifidobacterium criceti TaxID=1960969 RepID=A0A2A2EEC1_9BIFI|nr:hypothetical protein [Bifidobacterium criceti]PAU67383.1 phosphoesterase/phosphohydrolase [Bifidobacterium criceti]
MRYFTSDTHFGHPLVSALRGYIKDGDVRSRYLGIWRDEGRDNAQTWLSQYVRDHKTAFRRIADVDAHDNAVIAHINGTVGADDELWILGDVSFRCSADHTIRRLREIDCRHLHMVIGNHDFNFEDRTKDGIYSSVFETIDACAQIMMPLPVLSGDSITGDIAEQPVTLSHFPRRSAVEAVREGATVTNDQAPNAADFVDEAPATDGWLLYGHTHQGVPDGTDARSVNVGLDAWDMHPVSEREIIDWFTKANA